MSRSRFVCTYWTCSRFTKSHPWSSQIGYEVHLKRRSCSRDQYKRNDFQYTTNYCISLGWNYLGSWKFDHGTSNRCNRANERLELVLESAFSESLRRFCEMEMTWEFGLKILERKYSCHWQLLTNSLVNKIYYE